MSRETVVWTTSTPCLAERVRELGLRRELPLAHEPEDLALAFSRVMPCALVSEDLERPVDLVLRDDERRRQPQRASRPRR